MKKFAQETRAAGTRRRLLIVDSRRDVLSRMADELRMDFQTVSALDGEMALEILDRDREFDAVILRCRLYETSGFDVLLRLKSLRLAVPVIAVGEEQDELKALSMGASDFLAEPVQPRLLGLRLRNQLALLPREDGCDELTGLYGRQQFLTELQRLLQTDRERRYTLIYTNIPRFRVLNEQFGQRAGDQILCALGHELRDWFSDGIVGRPGEDHFVICCPEERAVPEELNRRGAAVMRRLHIHRTLRIHCGLYAVEDPDLPPQQICDRAEMALRTLGDQSAGGFARYDDDLRRELLEEQELTDEMGEALASGQFHIYLQPIYSLSTEKPVSAEALVRWIHPKKGLISPARFIPIFERNGFITRLDAYVWETTFRYLAHFRELGYPDFPISANMSRVDIYNPGLCGELTALARKYGVDPSLFRIEVTESAYMEDPSQLLDALNQLNAAGFPILMDDFGSGYSSLNMLMNIPVSTLKIDMGFVRGLGTSERTGSVVNSVIRMAKWLEMTVVTEGVETREQLDYLRSIGCDRVQGYYYSKPLPIEEFNGLIANFRKDDIAEPPHFFDRIDVSTTWNALLDRDRALCGALGAAAICEESGDLMELICVNEAYYRLMETTPDHFFRDTKNALAWMHEADRPLLREAMARARSGEGRQEVAVRRYLHSGELKHLLMSIGYVGRKDNCFMYVLSIRDMAAISGLKALTETAGEEIPASCPMPAGSSGLPKVLVVEDNQVNRLLLKKILSDRYEVLEAANGKEALATLSCNLDAAAILLDLIMPIMDGYEFLRRRQQDEELMKIPVLVLTQSEGRGSEIKALELGAGDFVRKPYEPAKVRYRLSDLIAERKN